MIQFLIKYVGTDMGAQQVPVDPAVDIFAFKGIYLNGVFYDDSVIATQDMVSGVSGIGMDDLVAVSGDLQGQIDYVSGQLDYVSGALEAQIAAISGVEYSDLQAVSGALQGEISYVSGQIDYVSGALFSDLQSVSGTLQGEISYVSGQLQSVSGTLFSDLQSVSGTLQNEIEYVSGVVSGSLAPNAATEEIHFASGASGQTVFTVSGFTFSASNTVFDIMVFKSGICMDQGISSLSADFTKISTTQIQFYTAVPSGTKIKIRHDTG